jgi:hypothetical protein
VTEGRCGLPMAAVQPRDTRIAKGYPVAGLRPRMRRSAIAVRLASYCLLLYGCKACTAVRLKSLRPTGLRPVVSD